MERKVETKHEEKIKKHPWPLLLFSIIFFGIIGYWIVNFSPNYLIPLGTVKFSILIPFFVLLFLGIYSFIAYLTISFLQGLILGGAFIVYLLLRYFGITHILFGLLLLAIVISLEFALYKKK